MKFYKKKLFGSRGSPDIDRAFDVYKHRNNGAELFADYVIKHRPSGKLISPAGGWDRKGKESTKKSKKYEGKEMKNIKLVTEMIKKQLSESDNKVFNIKHNVGKAKYVINYHDGIKKHKDGSPFFDIQIYSNKKDFDKAIKLLKQDGYSEK